MMKSKMMAGGGMMKKGYAAGGMPMGPDGKPTFVGDGKGKMAGGGMAKTKMAAGGGMMKKGYAAGGMMSKMKAGGGASSASKRADGVAMKGKTKGKLLAKGGMTK